MPRGASVGKRAARTSRGLRGTDRIGEVHQRLRKVRGPLVRPHRRIERTDIRFCRRQRRGDREIAGHHPLDIAIDDYARLAEGDGGDSARGIGSNPGKRAKPLDVLREQTAMIGTDDLRRAVQIAGAGVISEAGPGRHHILGRRRRKAAYGRPSAGEIQKIGDHRGHDGLLKHDFRQPHMIGRRQLGPAPPPGKRAAVPVIPGKYPRCRKVSLIHGAETGTAPMPVQ